MRRGSLLDQSTRRTKIPVNLTCKTMVIRQLAVQSIIRRAPFRLTRYPAEPERLFAGPASGDLLAQMEMIVTLCRVDTLWSRWAALWLPGWKRESTSEWQVHA